MVISSSLSQQIFQALPTSLSSFFTSSTQPSCPLAMNDKAPTHIYSKLNGDFFLYLDILSGIGRPIDLPSEEIYNVSQDYPNIKYFISPKMVSSTDYGYQG